MKRVEGDLIALAQAGQFDVIVHGCNCFNTMGAGIARASAAAFPEALAADQATEAGDTGKLGTITSAEVDTGAQRLTVVNAYTQFRYGRGGKHADYDAIDRAFRAIAKAFPDARIGYPMIGAGLAGGNWSEIAPIIDAALAGLDHTLVTLPDPKATGASR